MTAPTPRRCPPHAALSPPVQSENYQGGASSHTHAPARHFPGVPAHVPEAPGPDGPHAVLTAQKGRFDSSSFRWANAAFARFTGVVSQHPRLTNVHPASVVQSVQTDGRTMRPFAVTIDSDAGAGARVDASDGAEDTDRALAATLGAIAFVGSACSQAAAANGTVSASRLRGVRRTIP